MYIDAPGLRCSAFPPGSMQVQPNRLGPRNRTSCQVNLALRGIG